MITKQIPLTRGQFALVDAGDFDWLMQWGWFANNPYKDIWYALRNSRKSEGKGQMIMMHRAVCGISGRGRVQHINGDGLDNRRENLRPDAQVVGPKEWLIQFREVDPKTGCWNWMRCRGIDGYGQTTIKGFSTNVVHRIAYEVWKGPIPDGMFACHHCDNPPCFNPDHLFLGTCADNLADMVIKGRSLKGNHNAAKVQSEDVPIIRSLAANGITQSEIGARFGLCPSAVSRIVTRANWRNVIS